MKIYYYDAYYKYYLYEENIDGERGKQIQRGEVLPANATTTPPPDFHSSQNEIPVFINDQWLIKPDTFWRPKYKEINYNANRSMNTFNYIDPHSIHLGPLPDLPQLLNTNLAKLRILQSIKIINKKFHNSIGLHQDILNNRAYSTFSLTEESIEERLLPVAIYELKTELETIVYLMRRILDTVVQLVDVLINFDEFEKTKKIKSQSIGDVLKNKDSSLSKVILGDDIYEPDSTNFLQTSNDLFNSYKHTLIHDNTYSQISLQFPAFCSYSVKYSDHKKIITYHNHNAYHIMMGFEGCLIRICNNINKYRELNN